FGAADGMLHAICVTGTSADPTHCYGRNIGEEVWAIIPPAMRTLMASALASGDWSKVRVDGTMRVADGKDYFDPNQPPPNGPQVYRTALLFGMRTTGAVAALDISDPDPGAVNQEGFKFLWQNTGANVAASVTCPQLGGCAMGGTMGATLATPTGATLAL